MNITFFELEDWEEKFFKKNLKRHQLIFFKEALKLKHLPRLKETEVLCVFIYSRLDKKLLSKLPNLKFIATLSTGFDHIDLKECKKTGIVVSNVPHYGANTVAEHTFALILVLSRKIYQTIRRTRSGNFSIEGLRGFDLKGKTIGVIGTGKIGKHVIRMAAGFEMHVLAHDVFRDSKFAKKYRFKYTSVNNLLKKVDIVSLHCPYTPKTHHLINKKNIKLMKKNALLINTARGGLIDTHALYHALEKKHIAGAGLDVLEEECYIREDKEVMSRHFPKKCDLKIILENHKLMKRDDVLITPHNAFNSQEALQRILDTTLDNIRGFSRRKPVNTV